MRALDHVALGAWSGGRYLGYGEELAEERLEALLTPGEDIATVITADAYGAGDADHVVGRATAGLPRDSFTLVGAVGHDFYDGEREGPKGFPRFTDARLRGPEDHAGYLRRAAEASLERCDTDRFDLLLLHNPDHTGYTSEVVWDAMAGLRAEGLADRIGIAPGPANGVTLDLISCLERFGDRIDWAMLILNPFEPWPGELSLGACAAADVEVIARVVDYGGVFFDDVRPGHAFAPRDHRLHRPGPWIERAMEKLEAARPIAERHGLTMLQLAAQWDLAHPAVACVAPTLIQEIGPEARTVESKRAELAATPAEVRLTPAEVAELRALGDNRGSMLLKGATPDHASEEILADRWPLEPALVAAGERWGIDPERDLRKTPA
ncbi:MAG: aldo/keto reductase [Solirubrobacterales bacterium]|nr:aldo/keto reductase [Solirubrobacterales bacterium]